MKKLLMMLVVLLLAAGICAAALAEVDGDFTYTVQDNGTVMITKYNGSAKELVIPDVLGGKRVTKIGKESFYACSDLTTVVIPEGVTTIEYDAFSYCSKLASVTIPDSVASVTGNPFLDCDKLMIISVSPRHPYLATIDGVLFSKPDKRLICYPNGFQSNEYSVPQGIVTIEDKSFYNCGALTSVVIPDSVRQMNSNPFFRCDKLRRITVSSDHPYLETIQGVLFSKPDKRLVCYPGGLADKAYYIPEGTAVIGGRAFAWCNTLTSVSIPGTVTAIGDYAFSVCARLTSVNIPDSVTTIGEGCFTNCDALSSVVIPDGVTVIANSTFSGCDNLASVTIPDSVTFIADGVFSGCDKLNSITVDMNSCAEQYCVSNNLPYVFSNALDWLNN